MKLETIVIILTGVMGVMTSLLIVNLITADQRPQITSVMRLAQPVPTSLPSPTPTPVCANLLFGGDLMFDRHIREKAQARGSYDFILAGIEDLLFRADGIIANLEGPVTDFPSRSVGSAVGSTNNYFFTFDPVVLDVLAKWPFVLSLGNNHMLNFGQDGLGQTYQNIEQSALNYFGYVQPDQVSPSYIVHKFNDINVGLVNYNQFVTGGEERAISDLKTVRPLVEIVIVYAHWGNEYVPENQVQRQLAQEFIDLGADLVVGAHPHVVQGSEAYQGKQIFYSLGNFVFDQYFQPEVQQGLLVEARLCRNTAEGFTWQFTEHPTKILRTGETVLAESLNQ